MLTQNDFKGSSLQADRGQVDRFVQLVFRHADPASRISLRAFLNDTTVDAFAKILKDARLDDPHLLDIIVAVIDQAANDRRGLVFSPPICTLGELRDEKHGYLKATADNLNEGVVISVECDSHPQEAKKKLEALLGPATVVVSSGGQWTNPETGIAEDKLHLHWRLKAAARTKEEHQQLYRARELAAQYVSADATGKPIVHPYRWPGSWHTKREPRPVRIVSESTTELDLSIVLKALQEACNDWRGLGLDEPIAAAERRAPLDDIEAMAADLANPDVEFNDYIAIGLAFYASSNGEHPEPFVRWCEKSAKCGVKVDPLDQWERFRRSPPTRTGFGALVNRIRKNFEHRHWQAPSRRKGSEMFTDLGNARRLVRIYGEDIRYVHVWRQWLIWQDGHWRKDDDGAVIRMAKAVIEQMFAEAELINDETRRNAMRAHALRCQSVQRLAAMVKLAESEIEVVLSVDKIDADPLLLGVKNGVVDLRDGQFREARRDDYVTKMAGTAYDANAKCPNWDAFLKKIVDEPLIKYLMCTTGYVLTGLTGEEVMFIPWGDGNNGKSTYRETLFALLGDYAVGAEASLLITNKRSGGATPDLVRLHGRRLVTINETEENDHLNEARVKFITSHDIITARNLYEEPFDFTPTHKTMLTTNNKPIIKGSDEGIWRRIHLWPFIKVIDIKDRNRYFREQMLLPELPGILNWALDGLKQYQKNGKDGLNPPAVVTDATKEYREDMDLVAGWIEECCEVDASYEQKTSLLHCNYEQWAKNSVGFTMSAIALGRALVKKGFKSKKVGGAKGIRGLRIAGLQVGGKPPPFEDPF